MIQSMFRFISTTTFSKIFVVAVLLFNFISGDFDITIAGYKWVSLDELYAVWILYFSAVTLLLYFLFELLDCILESFRLRNRVYENRYCANSGLNAAILPTIVSVSKQNAKPNYGISKLVSSWLYVGAIPPIFYASIGCLAPTREYPSSVTIAIIVCFTLLSIQFWEFPRRRSSVNVLNKYTERLNGIVAEKLLEDCSRFDIMKEAFELGIGRTREQDIVYTLPKGKCTGERPNEMPCPQLHPGQENNQFLIYKNRASVIVVEDCDPLDAAWMAFKIIDFTGEKLNIKFYSLGTLPYALAASQIAHSAMGPGPWLGVQGIEHSLIWLGVMLAIGKIVNSLFTIAYKVEPLSGKGAPNHIICQWECTDGGTLDIYCDDEGNVRVRDH